MTSLALTLCLSLAAAASDPARETAEAFVGDLRSGRKDAVQARLGPRMQATLNADALYAAWRQLTEGLGPWTGLELVKAFEEQGMSAHLWAARFQRGSIQVTTAVDPKGLKVEGFHLKPMMAELPPAPPEPPPPPPPYVAPELFIAHEVTVGKPPFELRGTLTVPNGPGPFPAVVLLHGSGPLDRDETIGANKPFKDLAEGLTSGGLVVLRYDKRTLVHGRAYVGKDIGFEEEIIADALSALALVRARPEVDPKRVFLLGHSLGALVAPLVAARGAPVAGLALLAPPSRKPWDIILSQLKYLETPAEKVAELEAAFAPVRSGKGKGAVLGAPAAYWRTWAKTDGPALARALKVPVLVLRGSRDYQVTAEDQAGWARGLKGAKQVAMVELPGLNHLFIAGQGPSSPAEYEVPGHVAPEVLERLRSFLR